MEKLHTYTFTAELKIIGINPYVSIPAVILQAIFEDSEKSKGTIPVCGEVNGNSYQQTLLKYKKEWRLYINMQMLSKSPKRIGEALEISISYDSKDRKVEIHPLFREKLNEDIKAFVIYERLSPSLKKEINRYLYAVKKEETLHKNIQLALGFLKGENRFIGREALKI